MQRSLLVMIQNLGSAPEGHSRPESCPGHCGKSDVCSEPGCLIHMVRLRWDGKPMEKESLRQTVFVFR